MKTTPFRRWTGPGASILHAILLTSSFLSSLSLLDRSFRLGVDARIVNRTIDDTFGDSVTGFRPIYRPNTLNVWQSADCTGCAIQPDKTLALDGTWTAATYNPGLGSISVELEFTGVAVYIFLILANNQGPGVTTETIASFILDGQHAGDFHHVPDTSTDLQYNSLAFASTQLSNSTHNLTMATTGITENIFVNFDYAVYSFDEDSAAQAPLTSAHASPPNPIDSSKGPSSALVGGIVAGCITLMVILAIALYFLLRYRRKQEELDAVDTHPRPLMIEAQPSTYGHSTQPSYPSNIASYGHQRGYSESAPDRSTAYRNSHYVESSTSFYANDVESAYGGIARTPTVSSRRSESTAPPLPPPPPIPIIRYQEQPRRTANVFSSLPTGEVVLSAWNQQGRSPTLTTTEERVSPMSTPSPVDRPLPALPYGLSPAITIDGFLAPPIDSPGTALRRLTTANATPDQLRRERRLELDQELARIHQEVSTLNREARRVTRTHFAAPSQDSSSPSVSFPSDSKRSGGSEVAESTEDGYPAGREVEELKQQIRMMSEQIEYLQNQYYSAWAQGLTDEPPPGYSPNPPVNRPL